MPPRVRLAHKLLGWIDSDPRPIKEWIERQVLLKSDQLRRVIRYLKAWRDAQAWPKGDPKSLLQNNSYYSQRGAANCIRVLTAGWFFLDQPKARKRIELVCERNSD